MKNSRNATETSPAEELLSLKASGCGPHPLRPLEHLAFAILMDAGGDVAGSLAAISRLRREFVDWNEIRVSRSQEIVRALGKVDNAERAALRIKEEYNAFFDAKGALNFDFLVNGKPAEMRRALVQMLPHLSKGAVALLLHEFCPGASIPLSDEGLKKARKDGIVGKSGDRNQLYRVLSESLEAGDICLLLQYWELESSGSPYGEPLRKESKGGAKKSAKASAKPKAKASGKGK